MICSSLTNGSSSGDVPRKKPPICGERTFNSSESSSIIAFWSTGLFVLPESLWAFFNRVFESTSSKKSTRYLVLKPPFWKDASCKIARFKARLVETPLIFTPFKYLSKPLIASLRDFPQQIICAIRLS